MTLTELINEVYLITNRPDRVAETLSAVRSATLAVHRSDYYYKDIFETGIVFSTPEYFQSIEYRTLIPRWRAFKYLRAFDASAYPAPGAAGKFFNLVTPAVTQDEYWQNRENICYIAGEVIQVRSNTQFQHALLGCYVQPLIGSTDATYVSWAALDHPFAIVRMAAAIVLRAVGNTEEANNQLNLYAMELEQVRVSNIVAEGY